MLTYSKRISFLLGLGALIALHLPAQQSSTSSASDSATTPVSSPPAHASESSNSTSPAQDSSSPAPSADVSNSTSSALDYLYNHKAEQGSVAKEGMEANQQAKTDALAQDALGNQQIQDSDQREQFEAYLAMNEVPQTQLSAYSDEMTHVIDLLHQRKTTEAWQQLYALAKFQTIDSCVSWELANRIESIWNADQTKNQIA